MSIPFLTIKQVESLGLHAPKALETYRALEPFSFTQQSYSDLGILGYRVMYAIDRLMTIAEYWQGYIPVAEFKIHTQVFKPKHSVSKGTAFLLHGYLEHSGIYQPLIQEVLEQGFSVVIYDLPGHGLSNGDIANIDDFQQYQDVLLSVANTLKNAVEILPQPWLAIGQSTGGAIVMHHFLEYAQNRTEPLFKRALLLSPLVRPAKSAWWHNSIGLGIVKRVKSRVKRPFRRNNHNPEFLRFVRLQDPLQAQDLGMEWVIAVAKWIEQMEQYPSCRIPVWMVQGALDQTVDWQYNVQFIREKFRLQNCLILEEAAHQLVNERAEIRVALTAMIPAFLNAETKSRYYD